MATRKANKRPELKLLKGSFQTVEDTISTILNEKDEKIKELEKALEARNGKVIELETALLKSRQGIALRNIIHKEEINTFKGECQDSERQQKCMTAKIHLLEKASAETEKLRSQLESRKRKWDAVKQLMDGGGYDNNNELSEKERRVKLQSKTSDLVVMDLRELRNNTCRNVKGYLVHKNGNQYREISVVCFDSSARNHELTSL
jgi:hypothetical protein